MKARMQIAQELSDEFKNVAKGWLLGIRGANLAGASTSLSETVISEKTVRFLVRTKHGTITVFVDGAGSIEERLHEDLEKQFGKEGG